MYTDSQNSGLNQEIQECAEMVLGRRPLGMMQVGPPLILGFLLILLFYALTPVWASWQRIYEILFERGYIPHITVWLALLALADLLYKVFWGYWVEGKATRLLPLPKVTPLTLADLRSLAERMHRLATRTWPPLGTSPRVRRLAVGMLHVARGDDKENVREALRSQAQADEAWLVSRFALAKILVWAIPLLGFIGTVEGIGTGIGEFSADLKSQTSIQSTLNATSPNLPSAPIPQARSSAQPGGSGSDDRMKAVKVSLRKVTSGLGRAFDTTYLALVLTVFLMFFLSLVEKSEGDRITKLDELFQKDFVGRLPQTCATTASPLAGPEIAGLLRQLIHSLGEVTSTSHELKQSLGDTSSEVLRLRLVLAGGFDCHIAPAKQTGKEE